MSGSLLTPALITFTRNTAALNRSPLLLWQHPHSARITISDDYRTLAAAWIDRDRDHAAVLTLAPPAPPRHQAAPGEEVGRRAGRRPVLEISADCRARRPLGLSSRRDGSALAL